MTPSKVFLLAWMAITGLLVLLGAHLIASAILALIPALMSAGLFRITRAPAAAKLYTAKGEPPLTATYASDNLAFDTTSGRLWLRDVTGRRLIVDLAEVAAWEHTWTDTSNAWGHRSRIRNELAFRLRRLDIPTVRVSFRRYSDAFNGNKNFEEAATWQARLTTLING